MTHLSLLDAPDVSTIASPLCIYEPCPRRGRAVLGPPRDRGGCVNRSIRCLNCGATGEQSTRTEAS